VKSSMNSGRQALAAMAAPSGSVDLHATEGMPVNARADGPGGWRISVLRQDMRLHPTHASVIG